MKRFFEKNGACHSYRDKQFMCELDKIRPMWTDLQSGHCLYYNSSDPYDDEGDQCSTLIKCALVADKLSARCSCFGNGCRMVLMNRTDCLLNNTLWAYPSKGVFAAFVQTYYRVDTHDFERDKWPDVYRFVGSIKCRGYAATAAVDRDPSMWLTISFQQLRDAIQQHYWRPFEYLFCAADRAAVRTTKSTYTYPADCWHDQYPVRGAVCPKVNSCIPVVNIRDGYPDCSDCKLISPPFS